MRVVLGLHVRMQLPGSSCGQQSPVRKHCSSQLSTYSPLVSSPIRLNRAFEEERTYGHDPTPFDPFKKPAGAKAAH
eukprot:6213758-Pleurochrysis_carterae.AAC.4